MITREGHPFEGRALAVIGSIRRRGLLFALTCLPDGSRALIPAQWTDWDEGHCGRVRACREASAGSRALGSLGDLLQLRHLVDALRGDRPGSAPLQKGSLVQLNLAFFDPPDPPGGTLSESLWEQLDEPARCAALESWRA